MLASQSPRRAEILRQAHIPFRVRVAPEPVDEAVLPGESPVDYVRRLAVAKASAILADAQDLVLGADTTVVVDGEILCKPVDHADARRMLTLLSGRSHEVITGFCLKQGRDVIISHEITIVWFIEMSSAEIDDYVASDEPMDKAGAYAIQGGASRFIRRIEGCYFNVVGLPVWHVYNYCRIITSSIPPITVRPGITTP